MTSTKEKKVLSKAARDLIQGKNFGHIATIMPDGSPQVTPVWIDIEDDRYVLVNTAEGRLKTKNVARDPRVAVSIVDQNNPYRRVTIRGRVAETVKGRKAEDHIDKLAMKYMGNEKYPFRTPTEKRVVFKIKPEREDYVS